MKITLSIDSKETIEIGHSDLANIVNWLDDNEKYESFFSCWRIIHQVMCDAR